MKPEQPEQFHQPVAYDAQGRPLYAHPPTTSPPTPVPQPAPQPVAPQPPQPEQPQLASVEQQSPQLVQMVRPLDPPKQEMTAEVRERHEASMKKYPFLNLSDGEYVVRAMRRHPIGLFIPLLLGVFLIVASLSIWINYDVIADSMNLRGAAADPASVFLPVILFCILIGLGMYIAFYVYVNNKFFLTNESVIQEIQDSIFSRHEQTVSLANIEDASFLQTNIIQHIFNYGSIRLSTEGDETTYRFTFVSNPKEHIATLNDAVEAFKLGRPVGFDDS